MTARFPTMVLWGPEHVTFYNDTYAAQLGGKHPGLLGQPAQEWWPEIWDDLIEIFDRVGAGEAVYREDALYSVDRTGTPEAAYYTHSHSPILDGAERVCGIFIVVTETTRIVLAEQARAQGERRNRQILDSATDFAIIATNLEGEVVRWNVGAERIFGWTEDQMCGETVERIFTEDDVLKGRVADEMTMALEHGHGNDERWHMKADGTRFWAQGKMTPLLTDAGHVSGFVKVLSDRTVARRNAERLHLLGKASAGLLSADDPDKLMQEILVDGAEVLGYDQSYSYLVDSQCVRMQLMFSTNSNDEIRQWLSDVSVADVPLCGYVAHTKKNWY